MASDIHPYRLLATAYFMVVYPVEVLIGNIFSLLDCLVETIGNLCFVGYAFYLIFLFDSFTSIVSMILTIEFIVPIAPAKREDMIPSNLSFYFLHTISHPFSYVAVPIIYAPPILYLGECDILVADVLVKS